MSSGSTQRIRDRNKQALLRLKSSRSVSKFEHGAATLEDLCIHGTNRHIPTEKRTVESQLSPSQVISELRSQKDLFISHYRPSFRKSKLRVEDALIPSDSKSNSRNLRSPKIKSGRVSQLAGCVERLLIQDPLNIPTNVRTDPHIPIPPDRTSTFTPIDPIEGTHSDYLNPLFESGHLNKTIICASSSSPWYRHCRPKAPLLPPTDCDDLQHLDNSISVHRDSLRSGSNSSLDGPHDVDQLKTLRNVPVVPHSSRATNSSDYPFQGVPVDTLETDIGQENINWDSTFVLPPPPPLDNGNIYAGSDYSDLDRSFSLPSPPLSDPNPDENYFTNEELLLKPLASIANILPFHGKYGSRCPKWSADNLNRLTPNRISSQTDRNMNFSPNVPSPPPLIVERLPIPTDSEWTNQPQTFGVSFSGTSNINVARPTVLKREAPDGAEYNSTESTFVLELKRKSVIETGSNSPSNAKQFSDFESIPRDYSPKKSRTHLLLPSEHSAFLPVSSTRLLHRVSSPCVR